MLKSMTAYGRAQTSAFFGRVVVEIHCLNRKFLDIAINAPRELQCFDPDLRKWVSERLQRGRVTVTLKAVFEGEGPIQMEPNLALVRQLKSAHESIGGAIGDPTLLTADALMNMEGVLTATVAIEDEAAYRAPLREAFDLAMTAFNSMQEREGEALLDDIYQRAQQVRSQIEQIAPLANGACEKYRAKLMERIHQINTGSEFDDRIMREVALYAERIDIEEELTRMRSHLTQLEAMLQSEGPVGKTLDFLLQELFREINTIASKSSDIEISHLVVASKGELERIREQVQNVE